MKIALLAPAGAMHRYNGNFGHSLHYAPLTLTTLAALVPEEMNAEIKIYDESAQKIPLDLEADLVCITCITGTAMRSYAYADYFRKRGIKVVMGGVHPSMLPDEAAIHCDVVMTGFAEQTFPQMLHDFKNGCLKPRYHQNCDYSIAGKPIPRRDLLIKRKYITTNTVEAIRGCSMPCTFCAYPAAFGRKVYKRPIKEVINEIEQLHSKIVLFPDVNLIADRNYAIELFTAMIPLKKMWFGLATSSIGNDKSLLDIFRKSGCKGLLIGFESISQESQKFVHKGINQVANYKELMKKLHDYGILVQGCFAFGGDDEDASVFEKTVDMIMECKIDLPRFSILTPFPRTRLYAQLESENRIVERNWAMYDVEHCVFKPAHMTKEQLENGIWWAWKETYKMSNIFKRMSGFNLDSAISFIVNLGYKTYADKFKRFTRDIMVDNSDIC